MELFRYALQQGRLLGRPWLMAPNLERADGFDKLRREYRAAEERRRRLYPPLLSDELRRGEDLAAYT